VNSGSAVIFLGILTFPAGGVTAIIGLAKLSGQPNSRVGRRLLFTLGSFFWDLLSVGWARVDFHGRE
jgi:hypothetical protein